MAIVMQAIGQCSHSPLEAKPNWMPRLWQIWIVASILLLLAKLPNLLEFQAHDPDDYMRLLQVRDWFAGQGWYDTRQYRMNPPIGADIHWVRLGDLPLAAILAPMMLLLPQQMAEIVAMAIVPLLLLLVAMLLSRRLMIDLQMTRAQQVAGLILLPTLPLLSSNFAPLRVDYHGLQAIFGLAIAVLLLRGSAKSVLVAGFAAAVWLTLSLEGLVVVIGAGGWLAWQFLCHKVHDHVPYFAGLATGAILLTTIFRPLADFVQPYCDVLSLPHIAAFGMSASMFLIIRFFRWHDKFLHRLIALVSVATCAGLLIYLPLGKCALSPLANIDPLARAVFFDVFLEASPFYKQPLSVAVMTLYTPILIVVGGYLAIRGESNLDSRNKWITAMVLALIASGVSLLVVRAGVVAQLLALPFYAKLMMEWLPFARAITKTLPRISATLACLALISPVFPTAIASAFDKPQQTELAAAPFLDENANCNFEALRRLPPSKLFTTIAIGPRLLAITNHTVVAGTYHRNDSEIRDVILAMSGPIERAPAILHRYQADYVVICRGDVEVGYLAAISQVGLIRQMLQGRPSPVLQRVLGFGDSLLVYRVLPNQTKQPETPSPRR